MAARTHAPTFDYADWVAQRTRTFTGRAWLFQAIDEWLADPEGHRFFLITGEPGSGKSAVAARLLQFSQGDASPPFELTAIGPDFLSAVHVCSARDRRWINPLAFSESLALQLADRYPPFAEALVERQADQAIQMDVRQTVERVEDGRVTGIHIDNLHLGRLSPEDAFLRVVREPLESLFQDGFDESLFILVDAVDESMVYAGGAGIVDLLAQADFLPAGVRFLITVRPDERVLNQFLDATELNISAEARAGQNRADVTTFIRRSLDEAPALARAAADLEPPKRETLVADVAGRAAGNFLYVRFLLDEVAAGRRSLADLDALPRGLDGLYFHSLDRVVKLGEGSWQDDYAPLIGTLSVAQESPTEEQLGTFLKAFTGWPDVWSLLGDLGQFIETVPPKSDGGEFRYRLYHQSVADFLGRRYVQVESRRLRNTYYLPPEPWHRAIAEYFWERHRDDWSQCDRYGLDNLAAHLYRGKQFDRLGELINQEWMAARFEHDDYTYDGFLADLDLAWEHAHAEAHRQAQAGEEPALVDCVRYALIQTSINSLSSNYEPALVARAVETSLWSGRRALSILGRIPRPRDRAMMATALLETGELESDLHTKALEQGLEAALATRYTEARADALATLAPFLKGQDLKRGLEAALAIEYKEARVQVLAALAPQLEGRARADALERAMEAALAIGSNMGQADALAALAPHLEEQALQHVLEAILVEEGQGSQVKALTALAPYLQSQALDRALEAALTIEEDLYRVQALAALVPHLEEQAATQALERALETALATEAGPYRCQALAALAPQLQGQNLEKGLEAALAVEEDLYRAQALSALAPRLEGRPRARALEQALEEARAIKLKKFQADFLAALAPHLEGLARAQALEQALEAALAIEDEWHQAGTLAALAPQLEGQALERALEAALAIEDERHQTKALAALALQLDGQALERQLEGALAIEDEWHRAADLAALAPYLEGQAQARAVERGLEAALAIEHGGYRAKALADLAPQLEGQERVQTLERALEGALTFEDTSSETGIPLAAHLRGQALERGLERALADEPVRAMATLALQLEGQTLERALERALAVDDERSRALALAALAPHLEGQALERALEGTLAIESPWHWALPLASLAPRLGEQARVRALDAALAIEREVPQAQALAALAPGLEGQARAQALERALEATLAMEHEGDRERVLSALIPQLEGRALERGLEAALAIRDEGHQSRILAFLAPHLQVQALERTLETALTIEHGGFRAQALAALARQMEGQPLERALEATLAIEHERSRAWVLPALARQLEGQALERALEATLAIEHERTRAWVLPALARQLEGQALERALEAALAIKHGGFAQRYWLSFCRGYVIRILCRHIFALPSPITSATTWRKQSEKPSLDLSPTRMTTGTSSPHPSSPNPPSPPSPIRSSRSPPNGAGYDDGRLNELDPRQPFPALSI